MLVSELKKIIDIDSRISELHKELAALYSEREQYMLQTTLTAAKDGGPVEAKQLPKNQTENAVADWVNHAYEYLSGAWSLYGIKIPSRRSLKKGLTGAREVIGRLSAVQPELAGKLGVLLVPPSQILGQPGEVKHRSKQAFISLDDFIDGHLAKRYQQKKWRLIVVYQEAVPLNYGKANDILTDKKYMLAGCDTRALGVYEYYALSLQSSVPLDRISWTLLLKNYSAGSKTVASVTFINGQYRFEVDDSDNVFGDERFRPAVEVALI